MISNFRGTSSGKWWAPFRLLACGIAAGTLLPCIVAAQTVPAVSQAAPLPTACDSLDPDTPHSDALRKVCQYAVTIPGRMPNFTCEQTTTRYLDDHPSDVISAIVTYENGRESYREIKWNGQPANDARILDSGTWSTGQFGGDVRSLFDTGNKVSFQFVSESESDGRRVLVFQYRIAHQDVPLWRLHVRDHVLAPPYHGQLMIDEDTNVLLGLQVVATEIPRSFPMRSAEVKVEYEDVSFGDGTNFVLPLQSVVNGTDHDGKRSSNAMQYSNCHKFRATARVLPQ